jgi:hypothetical protein
MPSSSLLKLHMSIGQLLRFECDRHHTRPSDYEAHSHLRFLYETIGDGTLEGMKEEISSSQRSICPSAA